MQKDCSINQCGCRKHGLECTISCGEWSGMSCTNSQTPVIGQSLLDDDAIDILTEDVTGDNPIVDDVLVYITCQWENMALQLITYVYFHMVW